MELRNYCGNHARSKSVYSKFNLSYIILLCNGKIIHLQKTLWIERMGDSYWFCFLSNDNINSTRTSQSFIIHSLPPTQTPKKRKKKKETLNDVTSWQNQLMKGPQEMWTRASALTEMCDVTKRSLYERSRIRLCVIWWKSQKLHRVKSVQI